MPKVVAHVIFIATFATSAVFAQQAREVETTVPEYQGVRAMVPIPAEFHIKNEGGVDGAGLCVIASSVIDGSYQGVPEFVDVKSSKVWRLAKEREGGYYPAKLDELFKDAGVTTPYLQAEGSAAELMPVIRHYLKLGVPVALTMKYGDRYGQNIHHMVSCIHLDDSIACIVDNNFPNVYFWMTVDEFAYRLVDGPAGWVVVLLYGFAAGVSIAVVVAAGLFLFGGFAFGAAAVVVAAG